MALRNKSNGAEEMKKEREKQREQQEHVQNLKAADHQQGSLGLGNDQDYLRELLHSRLSEGHRDLLENLLSRDFVLANYNEAQLQELKYELEIVRDMFFSMHPDEECAVTGQFAGYVFDDPSAAIEPLTEEEKLRVVQFFDGVFSRITRAKGMKQQEMNAKTIRESRTKSDNEEATGGVLGRL